MRHISSKFGPVDVLVVILMNLMWGLNTVALKNSVDLVGPLTSAFLRQVIVLVACLPMLRIVLGQMRNLVALGFLSGAVFYILNNLAFNVSDNVSALAIAGQLGAPFSLILAVLILKERIRWMRISGMLLSFVGVAILLFDPDIAREWEGIGLITLCSIIWAICALIQRKLVGVSVLTIYAWVGLIGAAFLLPVAVAFESENVKAIPDIRLATFGWLLFSGLGSTLVGQGAMSWLFQRHPVSTVVPLTLATPVVAVSAAAWYFGTFLTGPMVVGGLIALAGVGIVTIRTARAGEAEQ